MLLGLQLTGTPDETWARIETLPHLGVREKHKVAEAVRLGIAWNFAHESAGGQAWPPLAPMTVGIRRSLGYAGEHPILQRSGRLKNSLIDERHPMNLYIEEEDEGDLSMEFGSLDPHFPLLHAGGFTEGGHPVPPRPMTVLGDEAISRLRGTIEYVLSERWGRLPHSGL